MNPKKNLDSASQVLQSLLQNSKSPLGLQFVRWRLAHSWEKVVGPEMARYTVPVGLERGRLLIWVSSSARLQEVSYLSLPLRDKINRHLGHPFVKFIRFTLDRKSTGQTASEDLNKINKLMDHSESGDL